VNIYLPGIFELAVFVWMLYASFQLAQPEPPMWLMGFQAGVAYTEHGDDAYEAAARAAKELTK
jgi:hypothetical protein